MKRMILALLLVQLFVSCMNNDKDYLAHDIELWRNSEVWDFAECISKNKLDEAEKIINQNRFNIDYREPKFGETLLSWAVWNNNIDAVKFLVEHGANPNIHNSYNGLSPITSSASGFNSAYSWVQARVIYNMKVYWSSVEYEYLYDDKKLKGGTNKMIQR